MGFKYCQALVALQPSFGVWLLAQMGVPESGGECEDGSVVIRVALFFFRHS